MCYVAVRSAGRVVGVGALWVDMSEFDPANSRCRTRMGVNHSRVPSFMMFRTHGRRHSNPTDSPRPNRAHAECGSCSRSRGTVGRHECVRSSKQPPPYACGCQSLTWTISYDVSHPWPPPFHRSHRRIEPSSTGRSAPRWRCLGRVSGAATRDPVPARRQLALS